MTHVPKRVRIGLQTWLVHDAIGKVLIVLGLESANFRQAWTCPYMTGHDVTLRLENLNRLDFLDSAGRIRLALAS